MDRGDERPMRPDVDDAWLDRRAAGEFDEVAAIRFACAGRPEMYLSPGYEQGCWEVHLHNDEGMVWLMAQDLADWCRRVLARIEAEEQGVDDER